jgi:hypothetical protein
LAVALSWIGIFEILLFIIRKKDPVDYNEYLRSRYNGWYANGNPYGNNYNQTNNTTIYNIHYRSYDCEVHVDESVYVTVAAGASTSFEYIYPCNPEVLTPNDDIVVYVGMKTNQGPLKFTIPVELVKAD